MKRLIISLVICTLVVFYGRCVKPCLSRDSKNMTSGNREALPDRVSQAAQYVLLYRNRRDRDLLTYQAKPSFLFSDGSKLRILLFRYHTQYDLPFHSTITFLTRGYLTGSKWHYYSKEETSNDFVSEEYANVLIEGDCTSDFILSNGGLILICGNLKGNLTLRGHGEIIIAGNIDSSAQIFTDGIVRIMVGGNVHGLINNKGSSKIFIVGDFEGNVVSGDPSTFLSISGDYAGNLSYSSARGSLLRIMVEGFMPYDKIRNIQNMHYTQVTAFVGKCDMKEGVLPHDGPAINQTWYVASEGNNSQQHNDANITR